MKRHSRYFILAAVILVVLAALVYFKKRGYTNQQGEDAVNTISNNLDAIFVREENQDENSESFDRCFKARIDKDRQAYITGLTKQYCDQHKDALDDAVDAYSDIVVELGCDFTFPDRLQGCEGESCTKFTHASATEGLDVFDEPNGKKIGSVKKGETLTHPSDFIMMVTKPGLAKVMETVMALEGNEQQVQRGSTFTIEHYSGEGFFVGCVKKHRFSFNVDAVEVLKKPQVQNWVKMKTASGVAGFVDLKKLETRIGEAVED